MIKVDEIITTKSTRNWEKY